MCKDGAPATDGKCGCSKAPYYTADLSTSCARCPEGCLCSSERGCYQCDASSLRTVTYDPTLNKSTCGCVPGAEVRDMD